MGTRQLVPLETRIGVIMQTKTNGHKTRNPIKKTMDLRPESLALALLQAPDLITTAQYHFDASRIELEGHVAALSIRALTEASIRVKGKDGAEDTWRAPANDQERRL